MNEKYWTLPETILWVAKRNIDLINAIPKGDRKNMRLALTSIHKGNDDPCAIAENNEIQTSIEEIKLAACNGQITAHGINQSNFSVCEIPDIEWISSTLKGTNENIRLTQGSNTTWTEIRFLSSSVVTTFPVFTNRKPKGRSLGDGTINDTKYLNHMKKLMETGKAKSIRQASLMAVERYGQNGQSKDADEKRLQRKYLKDHNT